MLTRRMIEGQAVVEDVLRVHFVGVVTKGSDTVIPARTQRALSERDGESLGFRDVKRASGGKHLLRSSPAVHHNGSFGHSCCSRSVDIEEPI